MASSYATVRSDGFPCSERGPFRRTTAEPPGAGGTGHRRRRAGRQRRIRSVSADVALADGTTQANATDASQTADAVNTAGACHAAAAPQATQRGDARPDAGAEERERAANHAGRPDHRSSCHLPTSHAGDDGPVEGGVGFAMAGAGEPARRLVSPDAAGIGHTPQSVAKSVSEGTRSALSPNTINFSAAVSTPIPKPSRRVGA
jgi:hypothetical protein